jgi:dTDP-4-amino-4,6-dideoxygalactose transaminase
MNKANLEDLALFGAPPAFNQPLYVGRPNIPDRQALLRRIEDLLDRRWLSNNGPYVKEFEHRLAGLLGVRHCVAVCNATLGLELTARALGWQGEVILPSFTFIATAHAMRWQGLTPVFCEVDPATHNLDPRAVERAITDRTAGIVGVHVWGRPCDVDGLQDIANRAGVGLVFDAAHALGCTSRGRSLGRFGQAEVFSFHATKFVNAFEGGVIATDSGELAGTLESMRNFGLDQHEYASRLGTNAKMSEISAAMGLGSLESMDAWTAVNRRNYGLYQTLCGGLPGLDPVAYDEAERNNYQFVVYEIDESRSGLSRDLVRDVLRAENIIARPYFYPGCHRMEPYARERSGSPLVLPETDRLSARVLALPTGTAVGEEDIRGIARLLDLCWRHAGELTAMHRQHSTAVRMTTAPAPTG